MIAKGHGRPSSAPPNFGLPLINRISPNGIHSSCHHTVLDRTGISITVVTPFHVSYTAFRTHFERSRPYGGLHQHTPRHATESPSCSRVMNSEHFAFSAFAATSSANKNSFASGSNILSGVAHSTVADSNCFSSLAINSSSNISFNPDDLRAPVNSSVRCCKTRTLQPLPADRRRGLSKTCARPKRDAP